MSKFTEAFAACNQAALTAAWDRSEDRSGPPLPPPGSYSGTVTEVSAANYTREDQTYVRFDVQLQILTAAEHQEQVGEAATKQFWLGPSPGLEDGRSIDAGQLKGLATKVAGLPKDAPIEAACTQLEDVLPGLRFDFKVTEKNGYRNLFINGQIQ
jgi:hypothetical protein